MPSVFLTKPDPHSLRALTRGWRQIWIWLPVVFALGIIFIESTDTFSAANTSSWSRPIIERWSGPISDANWALYHHIARKCGHFVGYSLVCLAFLRAWLLILGRRLHLTLMEWLVPSNVYAVASTMCIAASDEFHQTFLPSRTGKLSDVFIDTSGGIVLCSLAALARALATPRQQKTSLDLASRSIHS